MEHEGQAANSYGVIGNVAQQNYAVPMPGRGLSAFERSHALQTALHLAHDPSVPAEEVLKRAKAYGDFLTKGE